MRKSSKALIAAAVVVALVGVGTAAFAYWNGGSSTATSANAAVSGNGNITAVSVSTGVSMGPITPAQSVPVKISNNNGSAKTVTNLVASISSVSATQGGAQMSGCTASDYTLTQGTLGSQSIAANGTFTTSGAQSPTLKMVNASYDQFPCSQAWVNLSYTVS